MPDLVITVIHDAGIHDLAVVVVYVLNLVVIVHVPNLIVIVSDLIVVVHIPDLIVDLAGLIGVNFKKFFFLKKNRFFCFIFFKIYHGHRQILKKFFLLYMYNNTIIK